MAALGYDNIKAEPVSVVVDINKAQYVLCTLQAGKIPQQTLDLNFTEGEEVSFSVEGDGEVHLTGYLLPDPNEYEFASEEEFSEENEEDEEEHQIQRDEAFVHLLQKEQNREKKIQEGKGLWQGSYSDATLKSADERTPSPIKPFEIQGKDTIMLTEKPKQLPTKHQGPQSSVQSKDSALKEHIEKAPHSMQTSEENFADQLKKAGKHRKDKKHVENISVDVPMDSTQNNIANTASGDVLEEDNDEVKEGDRQEINTKKVIKKKSKKMANSESAVTTKPLANDINNNSNKASTDLQIHASVSSVKSSSKSSKRKNVNDPKTPIESSVSVSKRKKRKNK